MRISVDLTKEESIQLESIDVGVAGEALSFDITGTIRAPDGTLADVEGESLKPVEVVFEVV